MVRDMRTRLGWERVSDQGSRSVPGTALFRTLAARGGHAVPAGALRAAPPAIPAAPVWLAAVFAGRRGTKVLERIPGGGVGSGQGRS